MIRSLKKAPSGNHPHSSMRFLVVPSVRIGTFVSFEDKKLGKKSMRMKIIGTATWSVASRKYTGGAHLHL